MEQGRHERPCPKVASITYDCDGDALLVKVEQTGAACHTGHRSCFYQPLWNEGEGKNLPVPETEGLYGVLNELYRVILYKRAHGGDKSYTKYLFNSGQDKILKRSARNRPKRLSRPRITASAKSSTK